MRFGLKVNPGTWEEASRWARLAEQVGFDGPTIIAGWAATTSWPTDHGMAGVPVWEAAERVVRLAEFVGVVSRLLDGSVDDHPGPYYPHWDAAMTPGPVQARLPIIVAANAPKALAVAAAHADAWVTFPGQATEADFLAKTVERGRTLDRLPKPDERDVFDKVVSRLADWC